MKKRDRTSLKIKGKAYKLAISYFSLFIAMHFFGGVQSIANFKEVKQYKEVIEDFEEFLLENGVQNPIDVFDYFNYALWEGYLAPNKDYAYSDKRKLFFSNFGMGNLTGRGVCLNDAGMLKDLYEAFGYDSEIVLCYVPVGKIDVDGGIRTNGGITRRVEINETLAKLMNILKPITLFTGNHAVTVVKYEGEYYYFDPTNLVYLAKSDVDDLDIINGDGSFKKRYLMSFIYELGAFKNMFGVTDNDYNLEYLKARDNVDIDIEKLEEFYQSEKYLIEDLANSLNTKPQVIIILLAFLIWGIFGDKLRTFVDNIFIKKYADNEGALRSLLNVFFGINNIKDFEDVCCYLHYLINNGYLSYEHGKEDLDIKKSLIMDSISLVTVDPKLYGESFFDNYINCYFTKNRMFVGLDEDDNMDSFHMIKDENNRCIFYSYSQDCVYRLNDDGELVNGDKKYRLPGLHKKDKIMQSEKFEEDIDADIDVALCDEFYEKNKETIDRIAKSYIYVKENK